MNLFLIFYVFCAFAASVLAQNCAGADAIDPVKLEAYIYKSSIRKAETEANMWSKVMLKSEYGLPPMAQYNLRPRVKNTDYDRMEVKYNTDMGIVTLSQTRSVFAFRIQLLGVHKDPLTSVQAEDVAKKIFKDSEHLSLGEVSYIGSGKDSPVWLTTILWSYNSNSLKFYMLKTVHADLYQSQQAIGYGLSTNARWFTKVSREFSESPIVQNESVNIESQLFADPKIEKEKQLLDEAIDPHKILAEPYAPPAGLLYSLFANDAGKNDVLKMRYVIEVGETGAKYKRSVSLMQTPQTFNITVAVKSPITIRDERLRLQYELNPPADLGDIKLPLTLEQVEDLSKEIFRYSGDVTVKATGNQALTENQPPTQGTITLKREKQGADVQYLWTQNDTAVNFSVPQSPIRAD